jgi:hypothetical protein
VAANISGESSASTFAVEDGGDTQSTDESVYFFSRNSACKKMITE